MILHNGNADYSCQSIKENQSLSIPVTATGPVALMPCIFKIFEKILSNKIASLTLTQPFPDIQQQGFQKELGCLIASFHLQETLHHNLEVGSNVYISFLGTSKEFDTVWRRGLMVELHDLGIFWKIIDGCHYNT
jgi:hypothetical protein